MKTLITALTLTLGTALFTLTGCGGGGGGSSIAGIGGTGRIASGTVTGFGSIFLNDDRYDIASASCEVDDSDQTGACQANLSIGMVVRVSSDDFSGTTGTATRVVYDDDVEGPVDGLIDDGNSKRFTVLGTTVVVDSATTVFDDSFPGFNFDTINDNDVVEVSGLFDANGNLNATYIEKEGVLNPGTTTVELKGTAANTGGGAGRGDSFTINGITVNILPGADVSDLPGGQVSDGQFVEAKGVYINTTTIDANEVELEDDFFGNDEDDVSIEGFISNFVDIGNFTVGNLQVDASSATLEPASLQLGNGLKVEVEGPIVNGTLIADEVEAEGGEIEIEATVLSRDIAGNTITLVLGAVPGQITVNVDASTEMEDESGGNITVADIMPGNFLEVRAFDTGGSNLIATEIRRSASVNNDVILQGPLDDFDTGNNTITVLGILFDVNGSTDYEDANDNPLGQGNIGAAVFDGITSNGDIVKVKDDFPADGIADEVDVED